MAMAAGMRSRSKNPVVFTEVGKVEISGKPVGLDWVGGRGEHFLFTSPSQVLLYSAFDGTRQREWSFRPNKSLAFSSAVVAASAQGLLLGVQGRRRLVAWPDKASQTGWGGSGPEGLTSVETAFDVSKLDVSAAGMAWCSGQSKQGQELRVACYSTVGRSALTLVSDWGSEGPGALSASLAHGQLPLLLALTTDATLYALCCPDPPSEKGREATSPSVLSTSLSLPPPPDVEGACMQTAGMMWSRLVPETAFVWAVWVGEGDFQVMRMFRVSLGKHPRLDISLRAVPLYSTTLQRPPRGAASPSVNRRGSLSSPVPLRPAVTAVGSEALGLVVALGAGGRRGWVDSVEAEHGVVVGGFSLPPAHVPSGDAPSSGPMLVAGEGVIASVAAGEARVWRVEGRRRGVMGLSRALGQLSSLVPPPGLDKGADDLALPLTCRRSGEGGMTPMVFLGGGAGWAQAGGGGGGEGASPAEAVQELLECLQRTNNNVETQHVCEQGKGAEECRRKQEEKKSRKKRKRGGEAAMLAPLHVATETALHVAALCLGEDAGVGTVGSRLADKGSWAAPRTRVKGQAARGGGEGRKEERVVMWVLLRALIEAGKFPLREEAPLVLRLVEEGPLELTEAVLAGPGEVSERTIVCLLRRLLRPQEHLLTPISASSPATQEHRDAGQPHKGDEEGIPAREVARLAGLAVRRPCCRAFLRTALAVEMDGPSAALLLVLLQALLEEAVGAGGKGRPTEEAVLTWLESLLDAKFVALVVEGKRERAGEAWGDEGVLRRVLASTQERIQAAALSCQALEVVEGYIAQFRRAGESLQVIPDYSLDVLPV